MPVAWMTFGLMLLIQVVAAVAIVARVNAKLEIHAIEIATLRDWRHKFGPKEMLLDEHVDLLKDHEARIRHLETRP